MKAIPHGRFIIAKEYEVKNSVSLSLPTSSSQERFNSFAVEQVGHLVNVEREGEEIINIGDIILAKVSDANIINFQGQTLNYIDGDFCIKIIE